MTTISHNKTLQLPPKAALRLLLGATELKRYVQKMKKVILAAVSIPIILFMSLIGFLLIDMKHVEKTSEICLPLIPKINEYKNKNNVYPEDINLITGDNTLMATCNYQLDNNKYIFALVGSAINLQIYVYNSEQNTWYWD